MQEDQSSRQDSEEQKLFPISSPQEAEEGLHPTTAGTKGKGRKGRQKQEGLDGVNRGHWSIQENKMYHWFLEIHYQHFVNSHLRRTDKIFKTMEQFIGTRQAEQCRSHHQKMEKKHLNFPAILKNLRENHYASADPFQVQEDMHFNQVDLDHRLPTISELSGMAQSQSVLEPKTIKRKPKKSSVIIEPEALQLPEPVLLSSILKQDKFEQAVNEINMFEECFHNHLGDMSLHLKEDSCPFPFNFNHE